MPRKTFVAGDVLTASDMNTFLMDQSVMTFADSTARASAIGTATEGMLTYLEDTNAYEYWDGTAYEPLVGAATSGLNLITTASFSGAVSHSFGSDASPIFTSDYDNYKIILSNVTAASGINDLTFRLRANTTDLTASEYTYQTITASSTTLTGARATTTSMFLGKIESTEQTGLVLELQGPLLTDFKTHSVLGQYTVSGTGPVLFTNAGYIFSRLAYNGFTIFSGANLAGTLSVYGYKK
jgi:hypothetical protein